MSHRVFRVLIADYAKEVRNMLADFYTRWGCEAVAVSTAEEALKLVEDGGSFDILVTELKFGEGKMDGTALLYRLRKDPQMDKMKKILFTSEIQLSPEISVEDAADKLGARLERKPCLDIKEVFGRDIPKAE